MEPRNVAIIGLGVGACATYFNEGESLTFYELDPYIEDIASDRFTYLDDCKAKVTTVLGDARIQLEQAPDHSYDIIMVDCLQQRCHSHTLTYKRGVLSLRAETGLLKANWSSILLTGTMTCLESSSLPVQIVGKALAKKSNGKLKPFQDHALYCVLLRKGHDVSSLRAASWLSLDDYQYECAPWSDDYINTLRPLYIMLLRSQ